jgi:hypothetical protein
MVVQLETDDLEVSKPVAGQSRGRTSLQARWFIPLEMRVITAKKEALQALRISKNVAWDALTFPFEAIEKFINCTRHTPMNQRIRPCQLGVALGDRPKSPKLLHGIFLLV